MSGCYVGTAVELQCIYSKMKNFKKNIRTDKLYRFKCKNSIV